MIGPPLYLMYVTEEGTRADVAIADSAVWDVTAADTGDPDG